MDSQHTEKQIFKELFWFDHPTGRYYCAKAEDDEVYRVKQTLTFNPQSGWAYFYENERYMTREKYEKFLSEYAELPIVLTNV